jgi:hypothetical protein
MTDDNMTSPSGWPIENDSGSLAIREANAMHRRDVQRQREAVAARDRVLAAFPDAPPELSTALMQFPSLVAWLARMSTELE